MVIVNADPTFRNSAHESPTFGAITRINPTGLQLRGRALGELGVNFSKYILF